ncbi:hypothetical protein GS531_10310 [Rhodococcus hoagii]|nr:hypothetical protein [Prescottella equi]
MAQSGADTATLAELDGGGVGDVPLLPVAHWLLDRGGHHDRFSQAALLTAPEGLDDASLTGAVQAVLDRHDMLRARIRPGEHRMIVPPAGSVYAEWLIRRIRVDAAPGTDAFADTVRAELDAAEDRLDPSAGEMVQVVWLESASGGGRLLIVVHHLVVDGVSWRILVPDLATAWAQIVAGERPDLAPVGTSMRRWAHGLVDAAADRRDELELWRATLSGDDPLLGARPLDPAVDVAATARTVTVEVSPDVTDALLTTVPDAFRGSVNDGLLTALAMALVRWRRDHGVDADTALVTLEGHGREDHVLPGADLARTVGWFTTLFPIRLDLTGIDIDDAFGGGRGAGAAVKAVKEQLLAVPDHGIGYGMLRYLDDEGGRALRGWRRRR